MSPATLPRLLSPADVADWLNLSVRQVERMAREGQLPGIPLPDGSTVFDQQDLVGWLERRKQERQ
jgi:hypothetical protein